jgi:hypothetical protein
MRTVAAPVDPISTTASDDSPNCNGTEAGAAASTIKTTPRPETVHYADHQAI